MVLAKEKTNSGAQVYTIGITDANGSVLPVGKTFPQTHSRADVGELMAVHISGLSRRPAPNGDYRYSLVKPVLRSDRPIPARPSSIADIEALYQEGTEIP